MRLIRHFISGFLNIKCTNTCTHKQYTKNEIEERTIFCSSFQFVFIVKQDAAVTFRFYLIHSISLYLFVIPSQILNCVQTN